MSEKERQMFTHFVASPLFNERHALIRMLASLESLFLHQQAPVSWETLYQSVYPGLPFNKSSLKTTMNQLMALWRQFLALQKFQSDKNLQSKLFLQRLNEMDEGKYFPTYFKQIVEALNKAELNSDDKSLQLHFLVAEWERYLQKRPDRAAMENGNEAILHLINGFLTKMIRYNLRNVNQKALFGSSSSSPFLEYVVPYLKDHLDRLPFVVQVYYRLFEMLHLSDDDLYPQVRAMVKVHVFDFSTVERLEIYTALLNHASRQLNKGDLSYLEKIHDLYLEMLELKVILYRGRIYAWHLKNLVNVALRLQYFDWVKDFLEVWGQKVASDYAQNAYHYNWAMVHYYEQNYLEAERLFNRVLSDFEDVFYGLNTRGYLLQIYYETGNTRGMESLIHSFRMFLDRKTGLSENKKRGYVLFINHLKQLSNTPLSDQTRLLKLKADLESKEQKGMGSSWLLSKIEDLLA